MSKQLSRVQLLLASDEYEALRKVCMTNYGHTEAAEYIISLDILDHDSAKVNVHSN